MANKEQGMFRKDYCIRERICFICKDKMAPGTECVKFWGSSYCKGCFAIQVYKLYGPQFKDLITTLAMVKKL